MNTSNRLSAHSGSESGHSKLALMGLCILLLTAAIAKQLPAQAADASATVSLAGLDLSTAKGMQTARDRLHETAVRLCRKAVDPWSLSAHDDFVHCVDDATIAAVGQIQQGLVRVANAAR
jgi:UrcA family protein